MAMGIVKRRKGSEDYFYLQYSFRKDGKIIKKEKYLGKTIPENVEKLKRALKFESNRILHQKLESIKNNFQYEWKRLPKSAKEREIQEIAIAFTYNTNAIEGSKITLGETREIIERKISPNKPLRDVKESEEHFKLFIDMLNKKESPSEKLILKWHNKLFGETKEDIAGKYREYRVRIGDYRAPDWQDVRNLMKEFSHFIHAHKMNAVEFAARAHYRFEKIHPFGDGNGRVGRLLMNHILWRSGYPMLIIEYKGRKSYYRALEKDEAWFVHYFLRRYLSVHKTRIRP